MDRLEIILRHGATFWTAGNNGTILAVDRDRLRAASVDAEDICPAFNDASRIALKIMHKSVRGIAESERSIHMKGFSLLQEMGPATPAKIPLVYDGPTDGVLSNSLLLTNLTGLTTVGDHVEYLLMDWVDGTDFAIMAYRAALCQGLERTCGEYGDSQAREETRLVLRTFLDCRIMTHVLRLDPELETSKRAQRIGGQLSAYSDGFRHLIPSEGATIFRWIPPPDSE